MRQVTHVHESCRACECVKSHMCMSHVLDKATQSKMCGGGHAISPHVLLHRSELLQRALSCGSFDMGWLRSVRSLKLQVVLAKEPYKSDCILQKRPMILRSLLIVATPQHIGKMQRARHIILQGSFAEYRLFYRALLQKRRMILRSLLIVATPQHIGKMRRARHIILLYISLQRSVLLWRALLYCSFGSLQGSLESMWGSFDGNVWVVCRALLHVPFVGLVCSRCLFCRACLIACRALLIVCRALLIVCRALLIVCRALLYVPFVELVCSRCLFSRACLIWGGFGQQDRSNYRSLLQKSFIKETIFCKRNI